MKNSELINSEFKSLLSKFHAGNCNPEELSRLEEMLSNNHISDTLKGEMLQEIQQSYSIEIDKDPDYDRMFTSIRKAIQEQQTYNQRLTLRGNLMRIAAIVAVAFLLGGTLSYYLLRDDEERTETFCEVTAPMGSNSEIVLPDSSKVWLNAGSKIKYSTSFNRNDRFLSLEGEGYFKVAKNKKLPFIVDAYGFEVKAIGTEFNVKAYKDDETIETTMVEGKVTLQHLTENILEGLLLMPNQKATFFKLKETLTVEVVKKLEERKEELNYLPEHRLVIAPRIDPRSIVSWKDKQLIIEREQLGKLAEILSRKYNFNFEFKSEDIKKFSFSGKLEDETLQQVMNVIQISSPIDYEIIGKTVIIQRNDKRVAEFKKLLK